MINRIADDLEGLKEQGGEIDIESPEFLTTFMKVLRHGLEEHREEKIAAFRNVLLNTAGNSDAPVNEKDFYIRLIDTLTIDQIRILNLFYRRDVEGNLSFGAENDINKYLENEWSAVDEHNRSACLTELIRFFIITSSEEMQKKRASRAIWLLTLGSGSSSSCVRQYQSTIRKDRGRRSVHVSVGFALILGRVWCLSKPCG